MKSITVFTPTFNRAHLLPRLYKSLCDQTSKDFLWLIIDDGSTDDTKQLVDKWIKENKISIQYGYKENGGMHTGHNLAYSLIKTELNTCIDSDDYMPDNAIEIICRETNGLSHEYSGIIGLDADKNGKLIGTIIPEYLDSCKLNELYTKHGVLGDKKMVYRSELTEKYPKYPEYEGEKLVPLSYKTLMIDLDYDLIPINEVLCIVEYQTDGSTRNMLKQYRRNPKGFAFSRISRIEYGSTLKERFKNAIHLVSSALFLKDLSWLRKTNKRMLVLVAIPFGIILNVYIRIKTK
jgi:glycosyltransferase involved in cell wall biosynthesis